MELSRTRSQVPGHIALDDAHNVNVTTGNVGSDGRVKVHFHENPQALADWCTRCHRSFAAPGEPEPGPGPGPEPEPPTSRRPGGSGGGPASRRSPRLNIAMHIVGSRGDVQPFIPVAQMLARPPYGHRVRICTHPAFKAFVEAQGVEFFSLGGDPEALMAYMVKNPGLLPNRQSFKDGDVTKRRRDMLDMMMGAWRGCIEAGDGMGKPVKAAGVENVQDLFLADAIIANPPSMAHIHCAEKLGIPLHMVFTMPWSPTGAFPHPLASMSYGEADKTMANYLSFMVMELLTWQGLGDLINKVRVQTLHLDPVSPLWGYQLLPRLRVPYSYLWSQSLIPRPADWGPHINITGFSFLPLAQSYTPPQDLVDFLGAGPTPIYIGFGSIVVDDPQALTQLIFQAVKIAHVRAIVSKGWGGVGHGDDVPDDIYLIENCPHDWLFRHVSAVVHHGGAGTTAAGIAAGRPTVVVPFFGDQPFWGQMLARAGAGPMPVPFKKLTAEALAESIQFALQPEVQAAAQHMSQQIAEEDGSGDTASDFQQRLEVDRLRCHVCPELLATWVHKKTNTHLSGFAAACLIDKDLIQAPHIDLLHHQHWYVDEGAEHPLIGLVAAATGFALAVKLATSDYSKRLQLRPRSSSTTHLRRQSSVAQDRSSIDSALLAPARVVKEATPREMEKVALKKARRSLRSSTDFIGTVIKPTLSGNCKARARKKAPYVARATARYAVELTKAGLKVPVAVFYNVANGFHNYPSYGFTVSQVRRRDEITGLGSGLKTAGKEFGLGMWDAFTGIVEKPFVGAKSSGAKGFGKGIWQGGGGFVCNLNAAVFGLLGYPLKGLEKELSKHHQTELQAEILLIRLRQGIEEFRMATSAEREKVVERWKVLIS